MHNQVPGIHSNKDEAKEKEYVNEHQDLTQLDEYLIIATEVYECPWRDGLTFLDKNKSSTPTSMDHHSISMDIKVLDKISEG